MIRSLDEREVQRIMREIVKAGKEAYNEHVANGKGDYETFGKIMFGIYRSYYATASQEHTEAMYRILCADVTKLTEVEAEIYAGNYGLKAQAAKSPVVEDGAKVAREIIEKYGEEHAKTYLNGMNKCDRVIVVEKLKYAQRIEQVFKDVSKIV